MACELGGTVTHANECPPPLPPITPTRAIVLMDKDEKTVFGALKAHLQKSAL